MDIGITGLPGAGKTTVFRALTRAVPQQQRAVVKVPDARLEPLAAMFHPKAVKTAEIQYVDGGSVTKGKEGSASTALGELRTVDALLLVVGAFDAATVDGVVADLASIESELMLSDLLVVERRAERLEKEVRMGAGAPGEHQQKTREFEVLQRARAALDGGEPLRRLRLDPEEAAVVRNFGFLSLKPALLVANVDDDLEAGNQLVAEAEAEGRVSGSWAEALAIAGRLEMELAELDPAEAQEFMAAMGIAELCADRVIQASYRALDLLSFLTVGPDEVRAWSLRRGSTALDAAAAIHSDLARGFIRAEVVPFEDLVETGSLTEARHRGKLRSEGKSYVVQDGDVIHVLFNV